jgi:hypothetical protein
MIYEKYYSHIKSYERDEGSAFMDNVYGSEEDQADEEKSQSA